MAHDVMVLLKNGPITPRALADHLAKGLRHDTSVEITVQRDNNSGQDVVLARWSDYTFLFVFENDPEIMPECREMAHLFASGREDRFEIGNCQNRIRVLGADDDTNQHEQRARDVHRALVSLSTGVVFNPREPGFME